VRHALLLGSCCGTTASGHTESTTEKRTTGPLSASLGFASFASDSHPPSLLAPFLQPRRPDSPRCARSSLTVWRVVDDADATITAVGMQRRPDAHGLPVVKWLANVMA
jgi:hypothetical protein